MKSTTVIDVNAYSYLLFFELMSQHASSHSLFSKYYFTIITYEKYFLVGLTLNVDVNQYWFLSTKK